MSTLQSPPLPWTASLCLLLAPLVTAGGEPTGAATLMTRHVDGSPTGSAQDIRISPSGRFYVFTTLAEVDPRDGNGAYDVYLVDRVGGTTELVSLTWQNDVSQGGCSNPSVSEDGRYVAFRSAASDLVPGDTNGEDDAFVRDRLTRRTVRVSVSSTGQEADGVTVRPRISQSGRHVVFNSPATNLAPGLDNNGTYDVFVHDLETRETSLVSAAPSGFAGDDLSTLGSISADGRYVAFESNAATLTPGLANPGRAVFLRDRELGIVTMVSDAFDGGTPDGCSLGAEMSPDARYLTYVSRATDLVDGTDATPRQSLVWHDRETGETRELFSFPEETSNCTFHGSLLYPSVSGDGAYVGWYGLSTDQTEQGVFRMEVATGDVVRCHVSCAGEYTDGHSSRVVLSGDGSLVAFVANDPLMWPGASDALNGYLWGAGLPCASLVASPTRLAAHGEAVQELDLDAGTSFAGAPYAILGTTAGVWPGIGTSGGVLPLNFDGPGAYMLFTLGAANGPLLENFSGVLDESGRARASFSHGPATPPALVGVPLHHAFVVFGGGSSVGAVSHAAPLTWTPL